MGAEVKVVCAWCQCHISGDPDDPVVSHGICEACVEKHFPELADEMEESDDGED